MTDVTKLLIYLNSSKHNEIYSEKSYLWCGEYCIVKILMPAYNLNHCDLLYKFSKNLFCYFSIDFI